MKHHVNFTPGPSQLYFTASDHMRRAFRDSIPSVSHRSEVFENIFHQATEGLRRLLNIPGSYSIFFCSSATEIWERSIQNLVQEKSFHLVNGAFSKRYFEIARQLGKKSVQFSRDDGEGFDDNVPVPDDAELIAVTHNETSTGVSTPLEQIYALKAKNPHALIVVDAVSSLPYPNFDFTKIDSIFFSIQKGFGLPAGLGVWIVNEKCIEKAERLLAAGISIGTYHSLPQLKQNAIRNQTPETPNVLAIYLLGHVVEDFNRRGIEIIRKETEYKAAILYQSLAEHPTLKAFVKEKQYQSKTVIVADTGASTGKLREYLLQQGLQAGDGYGHARTSQLRFANFPAHSKEQFELLVDCMANFRP